MGCRMSCLRPSKPKSAEAASEDGSSSFIKYNKCPKRSTVSANNQITRYEEKEQQQMMMSSTDPLTLEDCLLDSPVGFKSSRRKIHPSSPRQVPSRRLIGEAKDSMCLERPMMMMNNNFKRQEEEEDEGGLSVNGKEEKKKVRFKLPHVVILYSPSEDEHHGYYYSTSSEDSFHLTLEENCRGGSFESSDEICFRLAVNTLPHASFSSGF